jgi:hypothetical protein
VTQIGFVAIDPDAAADWIRHSLDLGSDLSMLVGQRLRALPHAFVGGPGPATGEGWKFGRGISTADADAAVQHLLASMARNGPQTLVVEDDLARRGDSSLTADVAFVGDRVLRWIALSEGGDAASRLLRTGSSGYPLNAFLCDRAPSELGLTAGRLLSEPDTLSVAESVFAVITTIYDAETFLILETADLRIIIQ